MRETIRNDLAKAIRWLEIALQLIGLYYVGMMIKLNVYGEPVVMQFPNTPVFLTTVINEELEEYLEVTGKHQNTSKQGGR